MNWRLTWRRSWRQIIGGMAAVAAASMLLGGVVGVGGAPMARAASATTRTATAPLYGIPHETGKVTLPELSIDGPALWTQGQPSAPVGPTMILAWTGTDHRLNYMFGNGGITFLSGSKKILSETSLVRPAVVRGTGEGGFTAPVALAWIGTDSGHHLNVLYSAPGSATRKLTLWSDTSFTSPSLEWLSVSEQGGTLLLAWAGTDAGHSLNIMQVRVTSQGITQGSKTTYRNYHSAGQPDLIRDRTFSSPTRYFLGWSDMTSHRITWAVSPDAKTWTQQPSFAEMSGSGPSLMGLNEELTHFPPFWMVRAGTGADTSHHVNILYAPSYTEATTNNTKATLPETALGGPVVGFNIYQPGEELIVAWTGTDALHHINLATLDV